MSDSTKLFLADRMLGRLAKWLLIMGLDCEYGRSGSDTEIIERAIESGRILLTRNTRIVRRKRIGVHLFISSDHLEEQIVQVLVEYDIDPRSAAFSRCLRCNKRLQPADANEAGDRVPLHVKNTRSRLARCPSCNRFYWPATHIDRMTRKLQHFESLRRSGE